MRHSALFLLWRSFFLIELSCMWKSSPAAEGLTWARFLSFHRDVHPFWSSRVSYFRGPLIRILSPKLGYMNLPSTPETCGRLKFSRVFHSCAHNIPLLFFCPPLLPALCFLRSFLGKTFYKFSCWHNGSVHWVDNARYSKLTPWGWCCYLSLVPFLIVLAFLCEVFAFDVACTDSWIFPT